jgi:hypothetical protein
MSFATRAEVRDKIEWEGGYVAALDYGLRVSDMPEGDTELRDAWDKLWAAYREMGPFVAAVEKLLDVTGADDEDADPTGVRLP